MLDSEYAHGLKFRLAYGLSQTELAELISSMGSQGKADIYQQWRTVQEGIWVPEIARKKHALKMMGLRNETENALLHVKVEPNQWPHTTWFFGVFPSVPGLLRNEYPVFLFADKMLEYLFALVNFLGTSSVATGLATLEASIYDDARDDTSYIREFLLKSLANPTTNGNGISPATSGIKIDPAAYAIFQGLFLDASIISKSDAVIFLDQNGNERTAYAKGLSKRFIGSCLNKEASPPPIVQPQEQNTYITNNNLLYNPQHIDLSHHATSNIDSHDTTNNITKNVITTNPACDYPKEDNTGTKFGTPHEIVIEQHEWVGKSTAEIINDMKEKRSPAVIAYVLHFKKKKNKQDVGRLLYIDEHGDDENGRDPSTYFRYWQGLEKEFKELTIKFA